jgi:putative FmdB family regulatory protein
MPTYDYVCQDCNEPFELRASISEYSKGLQPRCPRCGSEKSIRTFTSINVLTARRPGGGGGGACDPSAGPGCCG